MIWLVALALSITAVTVWYMARPLARPPVSDDRERRGQLQQLRDRLLTQLNELDVEEGDRNIDKAVVGDERNRLEAELAQALRELESMGGVKKKKKTKKKAARESRRAWIVVLIVFAIVFPLSAAGLYVLNQRATLAYLMNPEGPANASVPPMVLEMVARLEKRLADQPDDLDGWLRLGRAYAVLGRTQAAEAAYARAYKLAPDEPQAIAEYAGFLYSSDPQNTEGQVYKLYSRLHQLDPDNQDALWFLGFAAYQKNDYQQALGLWERLMKRLPADSNEATHLRLIIDKTRVKLTGK
ncbi:MAG: tetratricopeptide repeat protein [Sulfuricaulis sp.]